MQSFLLSLIHGLDYLFLCLLVGDLVFTTWILPAGDSTARLTIRAPQNRKLKVYFSLLFTTSLLWLVCMSGEMTESWEIGSLVLTLLHTQFGHLWLLRILVLIAISAAYKINSLQTALTLALSLPIFSSLTGHAGTQASNRIFSVTLDFAHFLSVAIWSGGLLSLWFWLRKSLGQTLSRATPYKVVKRFSHFAMASTAVIAATGLIMAFRYGVIFTSPWATNYGLLLLIKTGLFSLSLLAASVNQFVHLYKWDPTRRQDFVKGVFRGVTLELFLVTSVLMVAGFLTRSPTPEDQKVEQVSESEISQ